MGLQGWPSRVYQSWETNLLEQGRPKLYHVLISKFHRGEDWTTYAFTVAVQRWIAYLPVSEGPPFVVFQLGDVIDPESGELCDYVWEFADDMFMVF